jgi:hypothetical protein
LFSIQIQITWSYVGGAAPGWPHGPALATVVGVAVEGNTMVLSAVEIGLGAAVGDVWGATDDTADSVVPVAQAVMETNRTSNTQALPTA